jgi:hypothetical protein
MRVLQIVPRLPPAIDGLGDYAYHLATELQLRQCRTTFVVADPEWHSSDAPIEFEVRKVRARETAEILDLLESDSAGGFQCAVLHYVNYAYARRGCPLWLVDACEQWAKRSPSRRLITVFHELYADGPPWKSEFWLSSIQVHLAKRLHRLSSVSITSLDGYARKLAAWQSKRIVTMPVFSNVGEPEHNPPLETRKRHGVIFGGRESRRRVYDKHLKTLENICESFQLEELRDIGPRLNLPYERIGCARLREMGGLRAEEVSRALSSAVAGIFDYSPGHWAKSGIFAAYCAHGVIPICMRPARGESDGITPDMYCLGEETGLSRVVRESSNIAARARNWYQTHTRRGCAEKIAALLSA